jgi:hypothetical protein
MIADILLSSYSIIHLIEQAEILTILPMLLGIDATISGELGNGSAQGVVSLQKLIVIAGDDLKFAFNFHLVPPLGAKLQSGRQDLSPHFLLICSINELNR